MYLLIFFIEQKDWIQINKMKGIYKKSTKKSRLNDLKLHTKLDENFMEKTQ